MAATNLLALLDDIATLLDDVAVMTKRAAKKTAGVLADDLALNAEQVSGVRADRELPVVWAVAKGSFVNKLILVPAALLISAFAPWAIVPLLMIGGAYLCFEGAEKVAHRWLHSAAEDESHHQELLAAVAHEEIDMVVFEQKKIRGAIRTDFILSAEIVVISLGTIAGASLTHQIAVLSTIAILITVGVYGLVAGIVKFDDLGLYWAQLKNATVRPVLGRGLLAMAPWLMKSLSVLGTIAMFLVGGGILAHGIHPVQLAIEAAAVSAGAAGAIAGGLTATLLNGVFGIFAGTLLLIGLQALQKLRAGSSANG